MTELLWILGTLAAIMVASIVTVVLIVRSLYRRVRRSKTVGDVILRTRAGFSRGPQRKVLELRLQLRDTLDSGQAAVDIASRSGWPRGELPRLFLRIQNVGVALDSQLRLMESETESAVLTEEIPLARLRVDQVTGLVRRLRSAVASGLADPTDDALAALRSDVHREVAALQAGLHELHALYERDGLIETKGESLMSNTERMRTIFRSKTSRALDKMEDPREMLDDSYDQQVKLLHQVRQALAEVATAKKRIELQGQEMGARYHRLASQAQEAMSQGREDLARAALERRSFLEGQVAKLQEQYSSLQKQTEQLQERERRLTEQIAAFRIEKETIKATYTASAAQVRANEAVAGIGSSMNDIGVSLDRARDKVLQMQARAAATDDLLNSGALRDLTAPPDADIERQLAALATASDVSRQLKAMKDAGPSNRGGSPDEWTSIGQGSATP